MSLELILRLGGGVVLVASNAFFVAAEFALTRLRQFSEDEIADRPGLREAWEMTERLEIHLTGCQLGITSSSILLGIVAEPDTEAEEGSGPGDVRRQVRDVLSRGRMSEECRQEVLNTLDIGSRPVRDIMIPRSEAAVLTLDSTLEENLGEIGRSRHVRYPLCRSEDGGVLGVVYVPALFEHLDALRSGETELVDLAAGAVFVDVARPVSEVIDRLQQEGQELALVRDGERVTGLVTVTDAFEAIAGDVEDPLD